MSHNPPTPPQLGRPPLPKPSPKVTAKVRTPPKRLPPRPQVGLSASEALSHLDKLQSGASAGQNRLRAARDIPAGFAGNSKGEGSKDALLNEKEAARFLNLTERTLQNWRYQGHGPQFVKLRRAVRYRLSDLMAFVLAGLSA